VGILEKLELTTDKMGLRSYLKRYKSYEEAELARRAAKKKRLVGYKALKNKPKISTTKRRVTAASINTALGNPYGVKIPSAKKIIKRAKRKKRKTSTKIVYVYK